VRDARPRPARRRRHVRRVVVSAWLIDKSAIGRLHLSSDAVEWATRIERGLVRISTVTRLEVGYSARSATDHRSLLTQPPIASMPVEYLTPKIEDRAIELQSVLAERGQHRAPSIPDVLIAATAELAELVVLHMDKDFELIADITGQRVERLDIR
jgi:predicted nucleic acid-binding protein